MKTIKVTEAQLETIIEALATATDSVTSDEELNDLESTLEAVQAQAK